MATDSIESTNSGCSSMVLILAAMVPFVLFWKPICHIINEYRLYRRCQQYPHIVVCKENSSSMRTSWERTIGTAIIGGVVLLCRVLYSVLLSAYGLIRDILLAVFSSMISTKQATTATAETPPLTELASSNEIEEERTMNSSRNIERQVKSVSHRPLHLATRNDDLDLKEKVAQRQARTVKQHNFKVQRPSEGMIFESTSFQNNIHDAVEGSMQQGHYSMALTPPLPPRRSDIVQRVNNTTHNSRPTKRRLPIQMVATMSTAVTLTTQSVVDIDSTSLSEKMRKRRLGGESSMGTIVASEQGDGDGSRKRRKLNTGRMPLQGSCYARRPTTVGAWQTTKILNKREREGREERLLRSMCRKRTKPIVEQPSKPLFAPAQASTATAGVPVPPFTPALNFGQTTSANTSTSQETGKAQAPVSTPAPTFQFGASGTATSNATTAAETKSKPAAKAPPAFSFGSTPAATTTNTAATSNVTQKSQPTVQAPPSFGTGPSTTTNPSGTASLPTAQVSTGFGAVAATPSVSAPSFGATPAVPTQAPTASGSVAPPVPAFGAAVTATSATPPAFGAAPAPSSFGGAQLVAAQAFGATTTQPPTTFGAPPAPATGISFGSTPGQGGTQFGASSGQHTSQNSFGSQPVSQGFNQNSFGSQPAMPSHTQQVSFGNTKENTNPGGFNSNYQASLPSTNGLLKPQPANNGKFAAPGFPMGSTSNAAAAAPAMFGGGFSAGALPAAVTTGASARRMARKSRNRRR